MSGLESHEKMITGRHSMTLNINDTMAKQTCETKDMAIVRQGLLKPQSFPNRAGPQKYAFDLVYKFFLGG
jgi:hypothetical protein